MQNRCRASMTAIVAVAAALGVVISAPIAWAQAERPVASAPGAALKTPKSAVASVRSDGRVGTRGLHGAQCPGEASVSVCV